jgi:hypothetical protein
VQTLEKAKGIEVLKEACAACAESIIYKKGRMTVKDEARVVRTPFFSAPASSSLSSVQFTIHVDGLEVQVVDCSLMCGNR